MSDAEERILCFKRKQDLSWEKFYITEILDSHYWSSLVSCANSTGDIAVAYLAYGVGVFVSWANVSDLTSWNTIQLSEESAPYLTNTSITYANNGDLLVKFGSSYRLGFDSPATISSASIPGELQSSQLYSSKLLALKRSSDSIRIYTSEDNGENWSYEYSTIKGDTIISGLFDKNGELSLFGARVLHKKDADTNEWKSQRIGNNDSNSNHTQLDTGQTVVLLLNTEGTLLLSLKDMEASASNQSR
jgi:hypothetical protein